MSKADYFGDFADAMKAYFGDWRGERTQHEIARWVREQGISKKRLLEVYRWLLDHHEVEPTNTIGIPDIREALKQLPPVQTGAPELEAPEENYLPRDECARRMGEVLKGLEGKSLRREREGEERNRRKRDGVPECR